MSVVLITFEGAANVREIKKLWVNMGVCSECVTNMSDERWIRLLPALLRVAQARRARHHAGDQASAFGGVDEAGA